MRELVEGEAGVGEGGREGGREGDVREVNVGEERQAGRKEGRSWWVQTK